MRPVYRSCLGSGQHPDVDLQVCHRSGTKLYLGPALEKSQCSKTHNRLLFIPFVFFKKGKKNRNGTTERLVYRELPDEEALTRCHVHKHVMPSVTFCSYAPVFSCATRKAARRALFDSADEPFARPLKAKNKTKRRKRKDKHEHAYSPNAPRSKKQLAEPVIFRLRCLAFRPTTARGARDRATVSDY